MRRVTMHNWAPAWKWPSPAAQTRHCPSWGHQHGTGDKETRAMSPLPPQCHTPEGATSEETTEHLCTNTAIAFVIILRILAKLGSNTQKELLKLYLSTYFSYFFTLFGLDQVEALHWQCARCREQELTICWRKIPFPPKKEICWCYLLRQTHIWPSQSWGIAYGIGKKKKKKYFGNKPAKAQLVGTQSPQRSVCLKIKVLTCKPDWQQAAAQTPPLLAVKPT